MTSMPPPPAGPPRSKLPMFAAIGAASAVGYYFYSNGNDPSAAKHAAKADAHRFASNANQAGVSAKDTLANAGATIDRTVEEGKQRINEGVSSVQETKDAAAKNVMGKVDSFDRKVEAEASKAKSGVAGWFGK